MKYLEFFEKFDEGKFSINDIELARKAGKGIFSSIVKKFPEHRPKEKLKILNIDEDSGEVTVEIGNNIYYVDLKNVEEIEK